MMPTNSTSTQQASSTRVNTPPATEFWVQFEEQLLDGRFPLNKYAGSFQSGAVFLSELGGQEEPRVVVKLVSAAASDAQALASSWSIAHTLQHHNLVRVYATGQASVGGLRVVYAVTDHADEGLDSIIQLRSLSESEARELLESSAHAVDFLQGRGLLHGSLEPSAIVAVGDAIKLTTDRVIPAAQGRTVRRELDPYDAPEVPAAGRSVASEIWALGAILYRALTRRLPGAPDAPAMSALPQPFAAILPNCLANDPAQRWMPRSIVDALGGVQPEFKPITRRASPPNTATLLPTASRPAWWKISIVAIGVLLLFIAWFAIRSRQTKRVAAVLPPAASRLKSSQQPPVAGQPAPMTGQVSPFTSPAAQPRLAESPARGRQRTIWRVVVYTYSTAAEAEKKAAAINRRWPDLNAAVFSPADHPPVLVVIGGTMDRDAANQLRRRVLASGFPSDTYISNYSR